MRFSVLFVLACLLMAVSCQKNVVALSPMPKPTLEQRLVGTWKWVEYVDFQVGKVLVSPANRELIYTFTTGNKYLIQDNGQQKSGIYSADTVTLSNSLRTPVVYFKDNQGVLVSNAAFNLSTDNDTLSTTNADLGVSAYRVFTRK